MTDPQIVQGLFGRDRWLDSLLRSGVWSRLGIGSQAIAPLLAAHANQDGQAWPSLRRLSRLSGRNRKTVARGLAELVEQRVLKVVGRRGKVEILELRAPEVAGLWPADGVREGPQRGVPGVPSPGSVMVPERVHAERVGYERAHDVGYERGQDGILDGPTNVRCGVPEGPEVKAGCMDGIHPNTTPDGAPESDSESGLRSIRNLLAGHGVNGQAADELAASLLEAGPADIARQVVDELAGESSKGENPAALLIWKIRDGGRATVQRLANHRQARSMERTESNITGQTYETQHADELADQVARARQHLASQPAEAIQAAWAEIIQVTRGFSGQQADDLEAIGDPLTDDQAVLAIASKLQPTSHPEEGTDEE